jgi:hypothetical protein
MNDEWNEMLRCPKCRSAGTVGLLQRQGEAVPSILTISDGFKAVDGLYGPIFYCEGCDVEVLP